MKWIFAILLLPTMVYAVVNQCTIVYQNDVGVNGTSSLQLKQNYSRKCLVIQNNGSSTVLIKFSSAHTGTENFKLMSGTRWDPTYVPINSIYMKSQDGVTTNTCTILEGN